LKLHPDISIRQLSLGVEKAPLVVIDNFVADAEALVTWAASQKFAPSTRYFPGIRAPAPPAYQQLLTDAVRRMVFKGRAVRPSMCHYSIVTQPPGQLTAIQRIPHVDSLDGHSVATIHYLFKGNFGGTAFYRHRKTGFEYIDESRAAAYFGSLEAENGGPDMPGPEYINGDTALFEQIGKQDAVFNRMLIYRRNSLHSACIDRAFVPDPDPLTGRLSINSFIELEP
jgi:hypothetical protein